jgi:hypothetical protein
MLKKRVEWQWDCKEIQKPCKSLIVLFPKFQHGFKCVFCSIHLCSVNFSDLKSHLINKGIKNVPCIMVTEAMAEAGEKT